MIFEDVQVGMTVRVHMDGRAVTAPVADISRGWVKLLGIDQKFRAAALLPVVVEVEDDKAKETNGTPVLHFDLSRYEVGLAKTFSGRQTIDTNDYVAARLRGLNLESAYEVAVEMISRVGGEATVDGLKARYGHLNPGMQRMNLGNLVRGAQNRQFALIEKQAKQADRI